MEGDTVTDYRLYFWEVGGSSEEPTDSGQTGSLEDMTDLGFQVSMGHKDIETLPDGRTLVKEDLAGYIVKPEEGSA